MRKRFSGYAANTFSNACVRVDNGNGCLNHEGSRGYSISATMWRVAGEGSDACIQAISLLLPTSTSWSKACSCSATSIDFLKSSNDANTGFSALDTGKIDRAFFSNTETMPSQAATTHTRGAPPHPPPLHFPEQALPVTMGTTAQPNIARIYSQHQRQ